MMKGIVVYRISRKGDIGEPGYSVYGEDLPACRKRMGHDYWHGATQESLSSVFPSAYITQKVYDFLTENEREEIRSKVRGIVPTIYLARGKSPYYPPDPTWLFSVDVATPMPTKNPCADVSCPDKCVGVDKYNQVCQDGICVRGTLIETDSVHCGYTPEPTPDPTPTPSSDTYIVVALMLAGTYIILRQ